MHELHLSQATGQAPDLLLQGLGPAVQGCGVARATTGWGQRCAAGCKANQGQQGSRSWPGTGYCVLVSARLCSMQPLLLSQTGARQRGHSQGRRGQGASAQAGRLS